MEEKNKSRIDALLEGIGAQVAEISSMSEDSKVLMLQDLIAQLKAENEDLKKDLETSRTNEDIFRKSWYEEEQKVKHLKLAIKHLSNSLAV